MANELEIREMARKLNLYNIARLETYQTDLSPVDYLSFLLQYEIDERKRRSVENNRRLSHLPKTSDREEFNGITKWMITKLQKCEWIEEESNLVISGKCGTGKTALATMLGEKAIEQGYKVKYIKSDALIECLHQKNDNAKNRRIYESLVASDLIILDEMMYLPISEEDLRVLYKGLIFLNESRSIIIVTNRMLADWDNACRDKHTIETLKDRLINDAKIIYLKTK